MSDLRELYQQVIVDHGRRPRHFGCLDHANYCKEGFNPLCGDQLTVYLYVIDGVIHEAQFSGSGCAISVASASLMMEALSGKTLEQAKQMFEDFHELVLGSEGEGVSLDHPLGKLVVLAGVKAFPSRVKCATLAWHTLRAAIRGEQQAVSTE